MPAVLIHGNPESDAIWDLLIPKLNRMDIIKLSPPGFGSPVPEDWKATRMEYINWLISKLEKMDGSIDLVGHDWGGGHVAGVAMTRPDLIRSWCTDTAGIFHPDYEWHEMAQAWQKQGVGESLISGMLNAPDEQKVANFVARGMTESIATQVISTFDEDMGRCILALYRDAAQPVLKNLVPQLKVMRERPGLVILAEKDNFSGTKEITEGAADSMGAHVASLPDVGHWWMIQNPALGATALNDFWAGLE